MGALCLCVGLVGLASASPASAVTQTLTVTTTADTDPTGVGSCATGGACTLREAVTQANLDSGDTISVPASTTPYTLAHGPLALTQNATLTGAGAAGTAINGNSATQILTVASPASVTVSAVKLENGVSAGRGGGAEVFPGASLTLSDDTLTGNSATNGGGAIEDQGALTVQNSLITNNSVAPQAGGAIEVTNYANSGNVSAQVTGTTISGNSASANGGAISESNDGSASTSFVSVAVVESALLDNATAGTGGAISNSESFLSVLDSTLASNTAVGDGGAADIGYATRFSESFINDTIVGNKATGASATGGDVAVGGGVPPLFDNTIVAGGTAFSGPDCNASVTSGGHNLDDADGCGFTVAPAGSDLIDTSSELGPLQNNGGPSETLALLPGSPAIDAGSNANCPATDQRGVARPQGAACDIGAYESAPPVLGSASVGSVGTTTAVLSAPVANPDVQLGAVGFQLGPSTSYGIDSIAQALPAGSPAVAFPLTLSGLTPGTTYHFRVVAGNADGTVFGPDQQFTTAGTAPPTPPISGVPPAGPANKFTFAAIMVASTGRVTVALGAPGAGRFSAKATFSVRATVVTHHGSKRVVKHTTTTYTYGAGSAPSAGRSTVEVGIALTRAAARELKKLGGARVTITVAFTPTGGTAHRESTAVTVRRSRTGRYR